MRLLLIGALVMALTFPALAEVSLTAPGSVVSGETFTIGWSGESSQSLDMITVVEKGAKDEAYTFSKYPSRETSPMSFIAPADQGDYEVRYLRYANPGYTVLARTGLTLTKPASVALVAPSTVSPGNKFSVSWSGPNGDGDEIRLVTPGGAGTVLAKTDAKGRVALLQAPNQRGDYLLQYVKSGASAPLATVTVTVGAGAQRAPANRSRQVATRTRAPRSLPSQYRGAGASVTAPESVMAGEPFEVFWVGPDNARDYLAMTVSDNPKSAVSQARTNRGNPVKLVAPDEPGLYRVHYVAGSRDLSMGTTVINVTASGEQGSLRVIGPDDSAYQVYDLRGGVAGAGSANDTPMTLVAGDYVVRVDGRVVQVRVRAGGTTDLNLK